jgi:hypothetical protein
VRLFLALAMWTLFQEFMIPHRDLKMTDRYAHLTSMRKLSKQVDLARFYENHGCMREPRGGHIGVTKGENESLNRKRAD